MSGVGENPPLSAWRKALYPYDPALAGQLEESPDPYAVLDDLGLPGPIYEIFDTAGDFMADPTKGLESLVNAGVTSVYLGARAVGGDLKNVRSEKPVDIGMIAAFLETRIGKGNYGRYNLRVAEFLAELAVVGVMDRHGTIALDIREGTLPPLTSGSVTPDFVATNDTPFGRLLYFGKDESGQWSDKPIPTPDPKDEASALNVAVRSAIWRAVQGMRPNPGYYELAIVTHNGRRVPVFADAILDDGTRRRTLSLPRQW